MTTEAKKGPLVLAILDGWGMRHTIVDNAIALGETPHLDRLYQQYPWCSLATCGTDVGLVAGQMGDSNVGHMNIGAGRIVYQWLGFLSKQVEEGGFDSNPVIIRNLPSADRTWHLLGLLSDGGVHSHIDHLIELLRVAKRKGLHNVAVHAFLDGRDVPPQSAAQYVEKLEAEMAALGIGRIASISGRFYAMDRDKRWERVERAWQAIVEGKAPKARSATEALRLAYAQGETDEFVQPTLIVPEGTEIASVCDGDSLFFFNFRTDRVRELSHAFLDEDFDAFQRQHKPRIAFATMTEYEEGLTEDFAFRQPPLIDTLGEVLAHQGLRQLRIAETEKYAHVTFFFDGGLEKEYPGCDKLLVPSPKVSTYDLQPQMSALQITQELLKALQEECYDVVILNFANGDMVGHTGVWEAALQAVACVDACVGRIAEAVLAKNGTLLITSDHGNCDQMKSEDGMPHTTHTTNNAPFILVSPREELRLRNHGRLADIAPTMLELLAVPQPEIMTGQSLLQKRDDNDGNA